MNRFFKSRMVKSMIPYFILALVILLTHHLLAQLISGESFIVDMVGRFFSTIAPFLTGAVIAYVLNLPCSGIQRLIEKIDNPFIKRKSRAFSVLALVIIVLVIIALILNWIIPAVHNSILLFIAGFPDYIDTLNEWIERLGAWDLPEFAAGLVDEEAILLMVREYVEGFDIEELTGSIISGFGGAFSAVFQTFLAIVSSIYILIEKDRLKMFVCKFLEAVLSPSANGTILKYSRKLNHNFHQYIYTQTLDGLILGTIMLVVLFLFGSPFALILALILGVLNYIPYFGSIIGTAIAVLVIAITQGLPTAALAAVVMFAIQQLDGNVIQPRLMGESFALSPLLIIISVTVGGAYGGILGMLVAIPIVAILKDLLDTYIAYRERKKTEVPNPEDRDFMDRDIW